MHTMVHLRDGRSASVCTVDCGGDGGATIDELITTVNVALGGRAVLHSSAGDSWNDADLTLGETAQAVNVKLSGCWTEWVQAGLAYRSPADRDAPPRLLPHRVSRRDVGNPSASIALHGEADRPWRDVGWDPANPGARMVVEAFVVRPNHVHGIIVITGANAVGAGLVPSHNGRATTRVAPTVGDVQGAETAPLQCRCFRTNCVDTPAHRGLPRI
jgi:hypothetical protein